MDVSDLLPSIPSLPPIKISDPSSPAQDGASTEPPTALHAAISHILSTLPPKSFAERVPEPPDIPPRHDDAEGPRAGPSKPLRLSLSVESFVRFPRPGITITTGSTNTVTDRVSPESPRLHGLKSLGSTHGRTGSVADDQANDSDTSRSAHFHRSVGVPRRTSAKGKEPLRPAQRGGESALPSRPRGNSQASAGSSVREENPQRLRSISSAQLMPPRLDASAGISSGRPRSGSLGVQLTTNGRNIAVNTDIQSKFPRPPFERPSPEVTLAVVGPVGCGKSAAIRKGLKRFSLTDPTIVSVPQGCLGIQTPSTYARRIGRIPSDDQWSDCALHVLEVDVLSSMVEAPPSPSRIWPETLPKLHGVIVCYDASQEGSFQPVEGLLQGFQALKLPIVVLACKSDLPKRVEPEKTVEILKRYDVGLVEVSTLHKTAKERLRQAFEFLLAAINRDRRNNRRDSDTSYRNPASPDVLKSSSWDHARTAAVPPVASSSTQVAQSHVDPPTASRSPLPAGQTSRSSSSPTSPVRARSTNDLVGEREKARSMERQWEHDVRTGPSVKDVATAGSRESAIQGRLDVPHHREHEPRPTQWATLDALLDKLIFLAITGDDPSFVTHFLLTFRRFATPRSLILAMQRRMRQLDKPSGDLMFACFGQMRICQLLDSWIRDYPHDFAVRGTASALSALVKSIIAKTYLLHYGSDFLQFLELLPTLHDKDASWALYTEDASNESDDASLFDEDDDNNTLGASIDSSTPSQSQAPGKLATQSLVRDRKPSLPQPKLPAPPPVQENSDSSSKQLIKELLKLSQELSLINSDEIANEITRLEARMFLEIEPRHWLQHTFTPGKKDPLTDPIARFNKFSNHLASWVVSLILCHERAKSRAKQIEKFIEVALKLRALHNYSALRAFVAGINNSTFPTDATMEIFKQKSPEHAKNLRSWDLLFQSSRSHRAYRMALKNTKGACIPALEVHISDLIQAHEGNPDTNPTDSSKIHWGKYNMIGKFINGTAQFQAQCRTSGEYNLSERPRIRELLQRERLMDDDLQRSRISPPDADMLDDAQRPAAPRTTSRDNNQIREGRRIKFFW